MKLNRITYVSALVALIFALFGVSTASGATGRSFEPGYAMSKQYVAVTTYKILRDHAPNAIYACESNVKQEQDRFNDLGEAPAFTRGAINCLDRLGYLADLPGGIGATNLGKWFYFNYKVKGVQLQETYNLPVETSTGLFGSLGASCSADQDDEDIFQGIGLFVPGIIETDDMSRVAVEYRFEGDSLVEGYWQVEVVGEGDWMNSHLTLEEYMPLADELRAARTGELHFTVRDSQSGSQYEAVFQIDGVNAALDDLPCMNSGSDLSIEDRSFEPGYRMSKQYVAVTSYKILRDRAPETIYECESNIKEEPSRFDDLREAGAFTRGAINCLAKLGYLAGLPGGTGGMNLGEWSYFSSRDERGKVLANSYSLEAQSATADLLHMQCGTESSDWDAIFLGVWKVLEGDEEDRIAIEYRFADDAVVKEPWALLPAEDDFTWLYPESFDLLASKMRNAGSGELTFIVRDEQGNSQYETVFQIDGVEGVLDNLSCM